MKAGERSCANQGLPRTLPGAGILPATGHFHRPASHSNRPTLIPSVLFRGLYCNFPLLYLPVPSGIHRLSSRQRAGSVPSAPAEPQFPPARSTAIASSWQALVPIVKNHVDKVRYGTCSCLGKSGRSSPLARPACHVTYGRYRTTVPTVANFKGTMLKA
jgi:hypothetical protein